MVLKPFPSIRESQRGITLIEIIIAIFIVAIFSVILIADFPEIQKQYALSSVTYKLAQDFRRVQDLGLSAVQLKDKNGNPIIVKGYGIYISSPPTTQYIIYADVPPAPDANGSQSFDNMVAKACEEYDPKPPQPDTGDCIIEIIDVSANNRSLYIKDVYNIVSDNVSVNFSPPGPVINIENLNPSSSEIEIILSIESELRTRTVLVNTSGLISVQ